PRRVPAQLLSRVRGPRLRGHEATGAGGDERGHAPPALPRRGAADPRAQERRSPGAAVDGCARRRGGAAGRAAAGRGRLRPSAGEGRGPDRRPAVASASGRGARHPARGVRGDERGGAWRLLRLRGLVELPSDAGAGGDSGGDQPGRPPVIRSRPARLADRALDDASRQLSAAHPRPALQGIPVSVRLAMLAITFDRNIPAYALVKAAGGRPDVATSPLALLHLEDVEPPKLPGTG